MTKIIDYEVVRSSSGTVVFEETVKEKITKGWQPIGGVAFRDETYRQAIVKYAD